MRPWLPPVVWVVVAFAGGCGLAMTDLDLPPASLTVSCSLLLIGASLRPTAPRGSRAGLALVVSAFAGLLWGSTWLESRSRDCRLSLPDRGDYRVRGQFLARAGEGSAPFQVLAGLPGECRGVLRAYVREGTEVPRAGEPVWAQARWKAGLEQALHPERSGTLVLTEIEAVNAGRTGPSLALLRGRLQDRLQALFGPRAALVQALVLARKEGLSPELRESFAVSGTAHLLAISGFHVGVIAGMLLLLSRALGMARPGGMALAAAGSWLYVLFIGAPHAAARAATILTFLGMGRLRGAPVAPAASLASAALFLLLLDPGAVGEVGFQLSFAGAAGLVFLRPGLARALRTYGRRSRARSAHRFRSFPGSGTGVLERAANGLAAGLAATLTTLPLVAWHFGRVSTVGIPTTLLAGPLVAVAIPGILACLALSVASPALAHLLSRLVDVALWSLVGVTGAAADLSWAAVWVPRSWLVAGTGTGLASLVVLRRVSTLRPGVRRAVAGVMALSALLLVPAALRWWQADSLEMHFLDVGQGDATALRTPDGGWIVVDVGPATDRFDAGERVVVPFLRRRGASRVELLVLTHPDQDHVGGASALLRSFEVGGVMDPGLPAGNSSYIEALREVREGGGAWSRARAGSVMDVAGVRIEVLHPASRPSRQGDDEGFNDDSVVLLVSYGGFSALLPGDAPTRVEESVLRARELDSLELLKVGHHGSSTSSSWRLLQAVTPELAVISVGRGNRYGHPSREVVDRLARAGARILRTDRHGTVRVRARRDGSYTVSTARGW